MRGLRVWDVELPSADGECHWRTIVDAASGRVLNVTDLVDRAFTDAQVNRWRFPGGDLFAAGPGGVDRPVHAQRPAARARLLLHDERSSLRRRGGDRVRRDGLHDQLVLERRTGRRAADSFIRATRRADRDFSNYFPGRRSETFGETNAYYWARQFAQWLKPSLDAMGVLPRVGERLSARADHHGCVPVGIGAHRIVRR